MQNSEQEQLLFLAKEWAALNHAVLFSLTRAAFIGAFPGTMATYTEGELRFSPRGKGLCIYTCHCCLTRCCSPERRTILAGNAGPCAHRSTGIPPHSGYHPKLYPLKNAGITTSTRVRERKRHSHWEVTRASAAVHAVFLTDLLNVETVTGCGAGPGAFTVLHSSWTLGD